MEPTFLNKIVNAFKMPFVHKTTNVFEAVEIVAISTDRSYVEPVRKSILKRFPVLFSLLVTLGATSTFLGIEQLILQYKILDDSPHLILLLGVSILIFTGRLYKKLG